MSIHRKGQYTGLIALIVLLFIATGNLFGAILVNDQVSEQVEYDTGDVSQISEAQLKADQYERRMKAEINYTSNNLAITPVVWENEVPTSEEAIQNHLGRLKENLTGQMAPAGSCSATSINDVNLTEGSTTEYRADVSDTEVQCSSSSAVASIPLDRDYYTVNNSNNSQVEALNYSANYTGNLKQNLSDNSFQTVGIGNDGCEDSSRETARDRARRDAVQDIRIDAWSIANDEKTDGDELDMSGVRVGTGGVSPEGACESYDVSSSSCTYDDCSGTGEDRECETVTGTEYHAECEWDTDEIRFEFRIDGAENEIMTKDGRLVPEFPWKYIYEP